MKYLLMLMFTALTSTVSSTALVDEIELQLKQNRDAYLAGPHTRDRHQAALDYFNQRWVWLKSSSGCGSVLLGQAGKHCIADRLRDGRRPWEVYYLDPIVRSAY